MEEYDIGGAEVQYGNMLDTISIQFPYHCHTWGLIKSAGKSMAIM